MHRDTRAGIIMTASDRRSCPRRRTATPGQHSCCPNARQNAIRREVQPHRLRRQRLGLGRCKAAVSQTGAHCRRALCGLAAADRSLDLDDSEKLPAESVATTSACSSTCRTTQRLKEPAPSVYRFDGASAAVLNEILRADRDNLGTKMGTISSA